MNPPESSSLSQGARQLMLVILGVMLLLSLYANVQRLRRGHIEKTVFTAAAPAGR